MWMMTYTNNTSGDLFAQYGMKNYILARRDALKENGDDFEIFYCGPHEQAHLQTLLVVFDYEAQISSQIF